MSALELASALLDTFQDHPCYELVVDHCHPSRHGEVLPISDGAGRDSLTMCVAAAVIHDKTLCIVAEVGGVRTVEMVLAVMLVARGLDHLVVAHARLACVDLTFMPTTAEVAA